MTIMSPELMASINYKWHMTALLLLSSTVTYIFAVVNQTRSNFVQRGATLHAQRRILIILYSFSRDLFKFGRSLMQPRVTVIFWCQQKWRVDCIPWTSNWILYRLAPAASASASCLIIDHCNIDLWLNACSASCVLFVSVGIAWHNHGSIHFSWLCRVCVLGFFTFA